MDAVDQDLPEEWRKERWIVVKRGRDEYEIWDPECTVIGRTVTVEHANLFAAARTLYFALLDATAHLERVSETRPGGDLRTARAAREATEEFRTQLLKRLRAALREATP